MTQIDTVVLSLDIALEWTNWNIGLEWIYYS